MYRLADSTDLCKALYYNEPNFLDQPDIDDTGELFYNNIFPFSRIPELAKEGKSYLTMAFKDYRKVNNGFKSGFIYLHTFTHVNLIRTDHGFLRYDFIISEIDKLMNDQRGIGIGKAEFYKMDEYYVNEQYMGMYVAYKLWEFN